MPNINVPMRVKKVRRDLQQAKDHALYHSGISAKDARDVLRELGEIERCAQVLRDLANDPISPLPRRRR
jgi:hypothetical protein